MANKKEKSAPEVKFITSLALAVNDVNDQVQHLQVTFVQEVNPPYQWRVFFDVVDPTKVPVVPKDDGVSESDRT